MKSDQSMADDDQNVRRRNVEPQSESDNDKRLGSDVNKLFIFVLFVFSLIFFDYPFDTFFLPCSAALIELLASERELRV